MCRNKIVKKNKEKMDLCDDPFKDPNQNDNTNNNNELNNDLSSMLPQCAIDEEPKTLDELVESYKNGTDDFLANIVKGVYTVERIKIEFDVLNGAKKGKQAIDEKPTLCFFCETIYNVKRVMRNSAIIESHLDRHGRLFKLKKLQKFPEFSYKDVVDEVAKRIERNFKIKPKEEEEEDDEEEEDEQEDNKKRKLQKFVDGAEELESLNGVSRKSDSENGARNSGSDDDGELTRDLIDTRNYTTNNGASTSDSPTKKPKQSNCAPVSSSRSCLKKLEVVCRCHPSRQMEHF